MTLETDSSETKWMPLISKSPFIKIETKHTPPKRGERR